jgi:hypothetical protein
MPPPPFAQPLGPPTTPPPWPVPAPPTPRRPTQWPTRLLLVTALAVIGGIAIGAWFRPLPDSKVPSAPPAPTYTDLQVGEAKASVCAAYQKVHHMVLAASGRNFGDDPLAKHVVAEGGWLAFDVGRGYLLTELAEKPATPSDLAAAIRKLTDLYQILAVDYMNSASDSELDPSLRSGDEVTGTIERLCK